MIAIDSAILVVSVMLTIVLALITLAQVVMIIRYISPFNLPDSKKYAVVLILAVLVVLLVIHIISACGDGGYGKDNAAVLLPGIFAIVFAITSGLTLMYAHKFGDKALVVYSMSFVLLWICVIVHVVSRVLL